MNSERRAAKPDITERTFRFAVRVARLCRVLNSRDLTARVMVRQLLRAGTSIGANMEEAQAGHSRVDFADAAPQAQLTDLMTECDELIAVLTAIVKKVKQPPK